MKKKRRKKKDILIHLRLKILENYYNYQNFADALKKVTGLKIDATVISRIVRKNRPPTAAQRIMFARMLNTPAEILFDDPAALFHENTMEHESALKWLLKLIDKNNGCTTYPDGDEPARKLHDACLELKCRDQIEKRLAVKNSANNYVIWKLKQ